MNEFDVAAIKRRWRQMVCKYSVLELTYQSDRLHAIQGCAELIENLTSDECISGLWKNSLLGDLLWTTESRTKRQKRPPELFDLPSWSWASVRGKSNTCLSKEGGEAAGKSPRS
jgi:hypothetical protein